MYPEPLGCVRVRLTRTTDIPPRFFGVPNFGGYANFFRARANVLRAERTEFYENWTRYCEQEVLNTQQQHRAGSLEPRPDLVDRSSDPPRRCTQSGYRLVAIPPAAMGDATTYTCQPIVIGDIEVPSAAPDNPEGGITPTAPTAPEGTTPTTPTAPTETVTPCPDGQERIDGVCVDRCPPGQTRNSQGVCVEPPRIDATCPRVTVTSPWPAGFSRTGTRTISWGESPNDISVTLNPTGVVENFRQQRPAAGGACVSVYPPVRNLGGYTVARGSDGIQVWTPIDTTPPPTPEIPQPEGFECPDGFTWDTAGGLCVADEDEALEETNITQLAAAGAWILFPDDGDFVDVRLTPAAGNAVSLEGNDAWQVWNETQAQDLRLIHIADPDAATRNDLLNWNSPRFTRAIGLFGVNDTTSTLIP